MAFDVVRSFSPYFNNEIKLVISNEEKGHHSKKLALEIKMVYTLNQLIGNHRDDLTSMSPLKISENVIRPTYDLSCIDIDIISGTIKVRVRGYIIS